MTFGAGEIQAAGAGGWLEYRIGDFGLAAEFKATPGQVLTLFGPSGAGKTTILRAIAGLIRPQRGRIEIAGRVVFDHAAQVWVPPHRRGVGFLTQDYHLFPHLSVAGNIAYGLSGLDREAKTRRVEELADTFQLRGLEDRRPHQISGGQQQRAALARALALNPDLLLLDEPFNSLDMELRRSLRAELKENLGRAKIPAIMVTHDVEEALNVGDVVQVIDGGAMAAIGSPLEILGQPGQGRVARLVGVENLLQLTVASLHPQDGTMICSDGPPSSLRLEVPLSDVATGERVTVGIRASDIILADTEPRGSSARNRLPGVVTEIQLRPPGYEITLACQEVEFKCHITGTSLNEMRIGKGDNLWAVFKASSCFLVAEETG